MLRHTILIYSVNNFRVKTVDLQHFQYFCRWQKARFTFLNVAFYTHTKYSGQEDILVQHVERREYRYERGSCILLCTTSLVYNDVHMFMFTRIVVPVRFPLYSFGPTRKIVGDRRPNFAEGKNQTFAEKPLFVPLFLYRALFRLHFFHIAIVSTRRSVIRTFECSMIRLSEIFSQVHLSQSFLNVLSFFNIGLRNGVKSLWNFTISKALFDVAQSLGRFCCYQYCDICYYAFG